MPNREHLSAKLEPIWTRDFTLVFLSTFALFMSFYAVLPGMPLFISGPLGGDERLVGLMSGVFTITATAFRPVAGYLMDRLGRRGVHVLGLAAFAVVVACYGLVRSVGLLLLLRLAQGLPWSAVNTAANTVAADLVPAKRRGEGLGHFGLAQMLALAVAPTAALSIIGRGAGRFGLLFAAAGGMAAVGAGLAFCVRHPDVRDPAARLRLSSLLERRVVGVSAVLALVAAGYGTVMTYAVLYARVLGLANGGLYFTAIAAGFVLARSATGRLFDRSGPSLVVGSGLLLLTASYLLLAWGRQGFFASGILLGFGFGAAVPVLHAMAANLVPAARRGASYATMLAAFDLGIGFGTFLLGSLAAGAGYRATFLVLAVLPVLGALVFWLSVLPHYRSVRSSERRGL